MRVSDFTPYQYVHLHPRGELSAVNGSWLDLVSPNLIRVEKENGWGKVRWIKNIGKEGHNNIREILGIFSDWGEVNSNL